MQPQPVLMIATGNAHKAQEIGLILKEALGFEVALRTAADYPHVPEPVEDGLTFEANALIKAHAYAQATGLPTLADDSGLVIDALDGRPGIQSARYAPTTDQRNQRVLSELEGVAPERRTARFECAVALVTGNGSEPVTARGTVEGRIITTLRGQGGFGYDPIFELTGDGAADTTMAELSEAAKNEISHRGRALKAIMPRLAAVLGAGRQGL